MAEPWSKEHIAPGSTHTSPLNLQDFVSKLRERKNKFVSLGKSGGSLEVYSENERVIANEIRPDSAAIWYCLYDNTLLNLIKDENVKQRIFAILKTYFNRDNLPIIPILSTQENKPPKYKLLTRRPGMFAHFRQSKADNVARVYTLYGGANLGTFLSDKNVSQTQYTEDFDYVFRREVDNLTQLGLSLPTVSRTSNDQLGQCEQYLAIIAELKNQLRTGQFGEQTSLLKQHLIRVELFAQMHTTLAILNLLGITHHHPHTGNWVEAWSKTHYPRPELEKQLLNPTDLATDYEGAVENYPDVNFYLHLIDFDQATVLPRGQDTTSILDHSRLQEMLVNDPNLLHRVLAIYTLPPQKWPAAFIESLATQPAGIQLETFRRFKVILVRKQLNVEILESILTPLLALASDPQQESILDECITALTPGVILSYDNSHNWKVWMEFFKTSPRFQVLQPKVFAAARPRGNITEDKFMEMIEKNIKLQ